MADGPPVQIRRARGFLDDCRSLGVPDHAIGGIVRAAMFQFERDASLAAKQWGSILVANVTRADGAPIRRARVAFVRNGDDVTLEGVSES